VTRVVGCTEVVGVVGCTEVACGASELVSDNVCRPVSPVFDEKSFRGLLPDSLPELLPGSLPVADGGGVGVSVGVGVLEFGGGVFVVVEEEGGVVVSPLVATGSCELVGDSGCAWLGASGEGGADVTGAVVGAGFGLPS
jgi:hypothetical protein